MIPGPEEPFVFTEQQMMALWLVIGLFAVIWRIVDVVFAGLAEVEFFELFDLLLGFFASGASDGAQRMLVSNQQLAEAGWQLVPLTRN
jgi:hypothetical protein